ncbi:hypothetical protein AKJ38_03175 [candidate division MSBL1 archaeon SCGC-AAA259I14]|uniref:TFIIB-type domain-containing protein n=1 Tax=candidate division MSBL1 archaeon SCGC-AAA259I14 TaxID=1698268 RepID=A0A133UQP4_9EURY|nr:hypothetical protein AKJ38_03175 [candidate division MSBL1 archaeon SCGC-AAA259I14]
MKERETCETKPIQKIQCPSCESSSVIQDKVRGEKICTRCGLVLLEKKMDKKPEWHTEPGDKSGRADVSSGSDITQHDLGLGSKMGNSRDLSPAWRAKLRRLRKWHRRARASNYRDKSLRQALINLDKLCQDLFLPKSVKAEASTLFRKARKENITPGRNTWSVLASLLFLVARMRGIPRTEKEIVESLKKRAEIEEKEAFKSIRRIRKVLIKQLKLDVPRPKPKEYLDRFISRLDLSQESKEEANKICNSLPDKFKSRKASFLVAAAITYNASRKTSDNLNIREIADVLNVGVSSVSKTGQRIRELANSRME